MDWYKYKLMLIYVVICLMLPFVMAYYFLRFCKDYTIEKFKNYFIK